MPRFRHQLEELNPSVVGTEEKIIQAPLRSQDRSGAIFLRREKEEKRNSRISAAGGDRKPGNSS